MIRRNGFTLIELLVVIAIIGILSSVVLSSLSTARNRAYDARRLSDLHALQTALEMYRGTHNAYPIHSGWGTACNNWGGPQAANDTIPGLAPTYIAKVPTDPQMDAAAATCCYLYYSDGNDYKLLIGHGCSTASYTSSPTSLDPPRDGGSNGCTVDANGSSAWAWAAYTPGFACY